MTTRKPRILSVIACLAAFALSPIIVASATAAQTNDVSFSEMLRRAEQGQPEAQHNIGVSYYGGESVRQDYSKAEKWFRKAAQQGFAAAQFNLGTLYSEGNGVTQSFDLAVYWWRKAAEQGLKSAQNNLGIAYAVGDGVQQDMAQAYKWFIIAGNDDAQGMAAENLTSAQKQKASAAAWSWGQKER